MNKILVVGLITLIASCGGSKQQEVSTDLKAEPRNAGELKIAFDDQDSVSKYFEYFPQEASLY